jgi:hypothetical protein
MHWFKFYGKDFLTDPKIRRLNPIHQLMWVYLLCHASDTESGHVRFIDENDLVTATGIMPQDDDFEGAKGFFAKCEKMDMIEVVDDGVVVKNFKKRQESYLSGAERTANWRSRKKQEQRHASDIKPRHTRNARIEKNRIDKKKEE